MVLDVGLHWENHVGLVELEERVDSLHFGRVVLGDGEEMKQNEDDFGVRQDGQHIVELVDDHQIQFLVVDQKAVVDKERRRVDEVEQQFHKEV